ncbi:MAG: DUF2382 domain-containing protein [Proteobacteria bacterium]|nr:MAG: DUF2382 domain-containing protein [Pseudomonadota bacterium]
MATDNLGSDSEVVLPLLEEALRLGKRRVETGRVRISVSTANDERLVRETLRTERAEVEHVQVNRDLAEGEDAPVARWEDDGTLVVPVVEEVLIIERRLVLREEVRLKLVATDELFEQLVTLRRQHADVERLLPSGVAAAEEAPDVAISGRPPLP